MTATTITLPNGVTLTGEPTEIAEVAKRLGYSFPLTGTYYSSSRGSYIKISDMNIVYIKNALLKKYLEWVDTSLRNTKDPRAFLHLIANGPGEDDLEFMQLLAEMSRRPNEWK